MPILSLEASTSAAKAMLYDRGQVLGVESIAFSPEVSDVVTCDPQAMAATVLQCGAALLRKHPGTSVDAIGLSSIWHSLVLLDGDRQPIGRGSTWADTSSAPTARRYRADEELARRIYRRTGCLVHSNYNIWKWMHRKATGDVSSVRHVSCLPEYLFFALTGELAISQSVAAGSGFLSAHTQDWDGEMLSLAGLSPDLLGKLVEPQYAMPLSPAAATALGLPSGIPVAACGPDGALNHIAAGGLRPGVMTLSVGTSGALRMAHHEPVIPERLSTWCYYGAEGMSLIGAATSGAGNCVNWFVRDVLGGSLGFGELEAAAVAADGKSAPYFLPFLFGERCPGWDDSRLGGFCALGAQAGVGALYRSVLEGILFNLYQNYRILVDTLGSAPELISISGGITQSPFWMALAADTFGANLTENTGEHASLLGAAFMAQRAVGQMASLADVPVEEGRRHLPDMARHDDIMRRYENWLGHYNK